MKILANRRKSKEALGGTFIGIILLTLLFLKSCNFYDLTVGRYILPLSCITTLIVAGLYLILSLFSHRAANVTLATLFVLISVIMALDLVYYNYAGKLTSVGLLKLIGQLDGADGTISELTTIRQLIPLVDLPVLFLLLINRQLFRGIREKRVSRLVHLITSIVMVVLTAGGVAYFMIFGGFLPSYIHNEAIIYHVEDAYDVLLNPYEGTVDKSLYSQGSQRKNPYYGVARDRNVFIIQVEALQDFVIGEELKGTEITPTLNSLIEKDSLYFENYYYQVGGGNTSDAEFIINNSLYPQISDPSYMRYADNKFHGLPHLLKDNGYSKATVFHGYYEEYWNRNVAYVGQGFDDFISIEDMDTSGSEGFLMGVSDDSMFRQQLEIVKTYEEPFYSFTVTLSSHHHYAIPPGYRFVDTGNPSPNLLTLYVQSVAYADWAIGNFIEGLKEAGLYENSIFVIYGDHYGITQAEKKYRDGIKDFTGEEYDMFERFSVPLIIHIPGLNEARTIDTVGSHIDVLPTLLCLLGIDNDKAVMFGHNLLDPTYEGISYQLTHLTVGSFITKDVFYEYTKGDINSKVFGVNGPIPNDVKYQALVEAAQKAINDSHILLEEDNVLLK